ncbi:MAG TPA: hypothetical protein VKR27_06675 [Acidimicrobiales bacterium]|nr:hypothetical protein [Acidimicrobiales bacterium]
MSLTTSTNAEHRPLPTSPTGRSESGRSTSRSLGVLSAAIPLLIAATFVTYELTRPHQLFGVFAADDGVYYGMADRLVHGVIPYRDFAIVHPPGIALLLAPVAAIGRAVGSRDGLAIARLITAIVAVANVALVCWILRYRGAFASFVGGLVLAGFPITIAATHTVLLEPYVVLFVLTSVAFCFTNGVPSSRDARLLAAGAAAGFACAIKIDAAIVLVVLIAVVATRSIAGATRVALGAGIVIVASCGPFAALAPGAFFRDVVVAQLARGATARATPGIGVRLLDLTGLKGVTAFAVSPTSAEVIGAIVGAGIAVYVVTSLRHFDQMTLFSLAALVATTLIELFTPAFYTYYSYLPTALFAIAAGLVAGSLVPRGISWATAIAVVLTIGAGAFVIDQQATFVNSYIASDPASDIGAVVDAAVPSGACVVFDEAVLAIASNRFDPSRARCPEIDDPFGSWLAADPSHPPPSLSPPESLVRQWRSWLARANYFLESAPRSAFVPWTPALFRYFEHAYRLVSSTRRAFVYENKRRAGARATP